MVPVETKPAASVHFSRPLSLPTIRSRSVLVGASMRSARAAPSCALSPPCCSRQSAQSKCARVSGNGEKSRRTSAAPEQRVQKTPFQTPCFAGSKARLDLGESFSLFRPIPPVVRTHALSPKNGCVASDHTCTA